MEICPKNIKKVKHLPSWSFGHYCAFKPDSDTCFVAGLQTLKRIHRHPGSTAWDTKRLLEDGSAAEISHCGDVDAV